MPPRTTRPMPSRSSKAPLSASASVKFIAARRGAPAPRAGVAPGAGGGELRLRHRQVELGELPLARAVALAAPRLVASISSRPRRGRAARSRRRRCRAPGSSPAAHRAGSRPARPRPWAGSGGPGGRRRGRRRRRAASRRPVLEVALELVGADVGAPELGLLRQAGGDVARGGASRRSSSPTRRAIVVGHVAGAAGGVEDQRRGAARAPAPAARARRPGRGRAPPATPSTSSRFRSTLAAMPLAGSGSASIGSSGVGSTARSALARAPRRRGSRRGRRGPCRRSPRARSAPATRRRDRPAAPRETAPRVGRPALPSSGPVRHAQRERRRRRPCRAAPAGRCARPTRLLATLICGRPPTKPSVAR